jgi:hypothetical protein
MVVGVGFCKIKVDSNFLLVLKIKCTKFHQDRSKTVDLHTKYTNKQTFSVIQGASTKTLYSNIFFNYQLRQTIFSNIIYLNDLLTCA